MSPALSVYLDVIRLGAALVVFLHHAAYERFGGQWLAPLSGYAHEAVIVFFVLSGFVIAYVVDVKERSAQSYAVARFSRLWSVAVPAIVATLIMDAWGLALAPEAYAPTTTDAGPLRILASVFFFNEWWFLNLHVGTNGPYWSLSFEGSYYLLFGILVFSRRPWPWITAFSLLIGPKILLMMPAWVVGVIAYKQSKNTRSRQANILLATVGAVFAGAFILGRLGNIYITYRWRTVLGDELFDAFGHAVYFVSDIFIAAGVAAHMLGVAGLVTNIKVRRELARAISKASAATFPIYVFHYPALYFFTAVSLAAFGTMNSALIVTASLAIGILATPFCESLRHRMRRGFAQVSSSALS